LNELKKSTFAYNSDRRE